MKLLLCGDLHCGSNVGLTPPHWQQDKYQAEMWSKFRRRIRDVGPFDFVVYNGDLIDGKDTKEGSRNQISVDRAEQVKMAVKCIEVVNANNAILIRGTPYHVGVGEDWEDLIADKLDLPIFNQAFPRIEGVNFSIRHHIGASTIAHGRFTALAKDYGWNKVWAEEKQQHPRSNILVRSHVHYYGDCGQRLSNKNWWRAMTLPALQGTGSRYGESKCVGLVDFGFVWMELNNGKLVDWQAEIIPIESQKVEVGVYE